MKTKMFLFCVLFSTLGISVSCNDKNGSLAVEEFETYVIRPYSNPFYGFGYNQYQSDFNPRFFGKFCMDRRKVSDDGRAYKGYPSGSCRDACTP